MACADIKIQKLHKPEKVQEDFVIVIDVLRAFTTAAYAFSRGAEKIILVSTIEEAFDLKKKNPEYLLMGEVKGKHIPGFDFCNSPEKISKENLTGRTLVQRTSAGTQGVIRSIKSKKILTSSFVVANATLQRIQFLNPNSITFVITEGDEDLALADYLEELLIKNKTDASPYLQRVINSKAGQVFANQIDSFIKEDLDASIKVDMFPFAMEIFMENNLPTMRSISNGGEL
ncbi:MAG: 2-phosphosulfolactate phosphatase [Candidatus Babeliales bacterium]